MASTSVGLSASVRCTDARACRTGSLKYMLVACVVISSEGSRAAACSSCATFTPVTGREPSGSVVRRRTPKPSLTLAPITVMRVRVVVAARQVTASARMVSEAIARIKPQCRRAVGCPGIRTV